LACPKTRLARCPSKFEDGTIWRFGWSYLRFWFRSLYFNVEQISADKGYSSHANIDAINTIGATPFVAFTGNAKGNSKSTLWNKAFDFFAMNRDEFLSSYHRRSNVESMFSAMKRKFGEIIRSKTRVAQRNELLLKVLCHNIVCVIHEIHESGATAMFPALIPSCPNLIPVAQQLPGWER
jgi:hypothetical protein